MNPILTEETVGRLEAEMHRSLEYWNERSEQDNPPAWGHLKENIEVALALASNWREQERLRVEAESVPLEEPDNGAMCKNCGRTYGAHIGFQCCRPSEPHEFTG